MKNYYRKYFGQVKFTIMFPAVTAFFLSCAIDMNAQTIQLGTGTQVNGTTTNSPVNIYFRRAVSQFVYTTAELNAAGISGACELSEMGWFVTSAPIYAMPGYTIKMKHVTASNVSVALGTTGWTTVKNAFSYMPAAGNWDMLTLDQPFQWNGVDNIGVEVCFAQVQPTWNSSGQCRIYNETNGYRYTRTDAAGTSCGETPTATLTDKPQVQMVWNCATSPNDAGVTSIDAPAGNLCAGLHQVVATIENFGTDVLNSVTVNWEVGGNIQPPLTLSLALDSANGSGPKTTQVGLGTYDFQNPADADIKAWTTDPNGVPDTIDFNDTTAKNVDINFAVIQIVSTTDISCADAEAGDGKATVTSLGGTPPFEYYWSHGDTGDVVDNLPVGTTNVILIDGLGCRDTAEVTIDGPDPLGIDLVKGGTTCKGNTNGMAEVAATGGVPTYTYTWNNGKKTGFINNVPPGTYTVTATDANNCKKSTTVEIISVPILRSTVDETLPAMCSANQGSASISAMGGSPPYSYNWSNGQSGKNISGLAGGNYKVTVVDDVGCETTSNVHIPNVDLTVTFDTLTLTSDLEGATYQWYNCDNNTLVFGETNRSFTPSDPGHYALITTYESCTDTSGCHSVAYTSATDLQANTREVSIFPNPNNGTFKVRLTGDLSDVQIDVIDMQGKLLMSKRVAETGLEYIEEFNGELLSSGVYLIRVTGRKTSTVKRMVVN